MPDEGREVFWLTDPSFRTGEAMKVYHTHTEYVPGCFRCDLSRKEAADAV